MPFWASGNFTVLGLQQRWLVVFYCDCQCLSNTQFWWLQLALDSWQILFFVSYGLEKTFGYPPSPPLGWCLHLSPRGEASWTTTDWDVSILQTWKLGCFNSTDLEAWWIAENFVWRLTQLQRLYNGTTWRHRVQASPPTCPKCVWRFLLQPFQLMLVYTHVVSTAVIFCGMSFWCDVKFSLEFLVESCDWFSLRVSRDAILLSPLLITQNTA